MLCGNRSCPRCFPDSYKNWIRQEGRCCEECDGEIPEGQAKRAYGMVFHQDCLFREFRRRRLVKQMVRKER